MDIYVGNLPYDATEDDLHSHFAPHAEIASVRFVTDRDTGRPRGFAFVTIESESAGRDAIRALDAQPMDGPSPAHQRGPGAPTGTLAGTRPTLTAYPNRFPPITTPKPANDSSRP